jgi:hypothetical protein
MEKPGSLFAASPISCEPAIHIRHLFQITASGYDRLSMPVRLRVSDIGPKQDAGKIDDLGCV